MASDADEASMIKEDDAFFTEEAYESFTIQPKFDVNLFIAYNPSLKGCAISPVKKRKSSQLSNTGSTTDGSSVQSAKTAPSCKAPKQGGSQKTPKSLWNLKSPKAGFPYPRHSCMTHAQQQHYIELWLKHGQRHHSQSRYTSTPEDITEKQQLRKLQILVHQEQQEFMKYAEHVARCSPKDYECLPPVALQYAKNHWQLQEKRVKQLPKHFSVCQTIGIVPAAVFPSDPVLTPSARLLHLGQPPVVDPYSLDSKVNHNLIPAFNRCSQHKQATGRQSSTKMDPNKELSTDENAVRLAAKYQANIVIAMASLATLADNHAPDYDKNWRIPVQICSTKVTDTDSALKTVYISDPLTNPCFPHEVSWLFHQVALHDLVTENTNGQRSTGDSHSVVEDLEMTLEVDSQFDDNLEHDLTSLETFGSLTSKSHHRKLKDSQVKHKTETMDSPPNHSQQSDIHTSNTCLAKEKEGNLECLPTHESDPSSPEVKDKSKLSPELAHGKMPSLQPPTKQLFSDIKDEDLKNADEMEESFRRESEKVGEQVTDQRKGRGSEVLAEDNGREACHRSQYENWERSLASESSEAEGELVIALSSGTDSPLKTPKSQSALMKGITAVKGVGKHNIDSEGKDPNTTGSDEQLHTGKSMPKARRQEAALSGEPKDAPTPRRSRRLQRSQSSDSSNAAQPHSLAKSSELPLPFVQVSVAEGTADGENSRLLAITPQEAMGEVVPDLPLSPPPHEKGLAIRNPSTEKRTLVQEPDSLQLKKQKVTSRSVADSSAGESKPTACLRYNLRSKTSGSGSKDQSMDVGVETISKEQKAGGSVSCELSLHSTRTMPLTSEACSSKLMTGQAECDLPVAEGNKNVLSKPARDSTKCSGQDSRSPKRRPTQPAKQSLATGASGVKSTIDSILKLQERLHSGKVVPQPPVQPPNSAGIGTGTMQMNAQGDGYMENASDYKTLSEGNADYSLWRFGRHLLVVRSNVDAIILNHAGGSPNMTQVVTIQPKMEYQAHFGHEQISVSELTKLWMSLFLQPGSRVIQGRVNALTSDLMMLEQFDMKSPLWDQQYFQPTRCMKMMFQILDKLTSLPEGHYLLCHSAGDMHACILQTTTSGTKRSLFDLHQSYTQGPMMQSCPPQLLPWLPLDTNMMLPGQSTAGRIPATFPPKNTGTNPRGGVTKGASKKKKKKGGKK